MSNVLVEPAAWAKQQFAECDLGDVRRTKRLVQIAAQAAARPDGSTPDQTESWGACKAVYRLMDCDDVSHAKIIGPHCEQTRRSCPAGSVQLILCDTTGIDYGRFVTGLGRIGRAKANHGFYLHTGLLRDVIDAVPHHEADRAVAGVEQGQGDMAADETRDPGQKDAIGHESHLLELNGVYDIRSIRSTRFS